MIGAGNRNRTGTDFTPRDFKSLVSTYSTMPACMVIFAFTEIGLRYNATGVVRMAPVAVPGIFVADGAASSSADRSHSLGSLYPPLAALPSLTLVSTYSTMPAWEYNTIDCAVRQVNKF